MLCELPSERGETCLSPIGYSLSIELRKALTRSPGLVAPTRDAAETGGAGELLQSPVGAPAQTAYGAAPGDDDGAALQAATPRGSAPRTLPQHRLTQKPRTAAQTRG